MKGDFSRFSFDKKKRYSAVLMQQGRLQLDSDWNEQVQISEHRNTAFFRDLVGRSGTPAGNAMTLLLEKETGKLTLTRGVCYIDGLFVENDAPMELTKEALPEGGGEFLFYVDAWTREVNASEDKELVDPAVGLETTTRLKTEWKLRYKEIPKAGTDKWKEAFEGGRWPEVSAKELPSGLGEDNWWWPLSTGKMKLSSREVSAKDSRLYRIEIHDGGPAVRFKWSRDNASVCAEVQAEEDGSYRLANNSVPIQEAFKDAAWIELCSPEEAGVLLDMKKAAFAEGLLKPGSEYVEALSNFKGAKKTIIRRWDGVFCKGEKENSLKAELGVEAEHSEGFYRSGDYWLLLIRDGEVLNWGGEALLPEGVVHHFAALASVKISKEGRIEEPESWHLHFNPLTSPNLTAESDLNVGSLTVRLNAEIKGNTSVGGTLSASLTANIKGNTSIGGALTVSGTGSSSIAGPLALSGNTTIGTASANRTLTVNGAASVSGAFTAGSTASIAGNTTLSGNLQGTTGSFSAPASPMELLLLGVTPQSLTFDSGIADKKTVELFSKASWSASSSATNWCTVTPTSGNGNATPTVNVGENTGTAVRTATVTFTAGGQSRTVSVTQPALLAPLISGFIPSEAAHSETLSIFGTNFNPTPSNNVVRLNGVPAVVTSATATQLMVTVPKHANCGGRITVTVGNRTATSVAAFSYRATSFTVSTIAGRGGMAGFLDGAGTTAMFNSPHGGPLDASGNLYVTDYLNHRIRKISLDPDGKTWKVTTFAGSGVAGHVNGTGTAAQFQHPACVSIDASGIFYVADTNNHRIRRVTQEGAVTTFAGSGTAGSANGTGTAAQFNRPCGIAVNASSGDLYVVDIENHRIRKVTKEGVVSTFVGGTQGSANGMGTAAQFNRPHEIAIDTAGNLYVADSENHRIRKVTKDGMVSTLAGSTKGFADGVGTAAQFDWPRGITLDRAGNLYVADWLNNRIRKITPQGEVTTIAGSGATGRGNGGLVNGMGAVARFNGPVGIIMDTSGNLYVFENDNHCIRKIVLE